MNEKRLLLLSFFVVAFLMFSLAGWYYFSQQKQAVDVVVDRNYDYVMKNDPIGKINRRKPIITPLCCLGHRHSVNDNVNNTAIICRPLCNINAA